jgi:hypothetical protein
MWYDFGIARTKYESDYPNRISSMDQKKIILAKRKKRKVQMYTLRGD